MTTRRILIYLPVFIILVLLQSYFWVPTYEQQTKGNPNRLSRFINASLGDASLLNPILSAESASSDIESKVFEGLVDRDENLRFRGRLATHWEIYEEVFFYAPSTHSADGDTSASADKVVKTIRNARSAGKPLDPRLEKTLRNIRRMTVIEPQTIQTEYQIPSSQDSGQMIPLEVTLKAPARIKLTLAEVDPHVFDRLALVLGDNYFKRFQPGRHITTVPAVGPEETAVLAEKLLPAVEHNPIIEFHLRPGVTFHDGHPVDAGDVKFTYESIMAPRNLSPRRADYEPVKRVEVLNPLTVRIVYKRLYSPAFGTWAMGLLPEHLLNAKALENEALSAGKDPAKFGMRQSRFNRNPIGCGPFVFREWKSDQYIKLERFEDYWEGPPHYAEYILRIIPDLLTQEMEFYAGTIDDYGVPPHQVARLRQDDRFQSFSGTAFGYTYIGYNLRRKPFDDPRVRKALGMAIDTEKLIKYVLYGQGERITGPFPKQTDFYNHAIEPLPYDPEGAKRLLADAGWQRNADGYLEKNGRPLRFTLITNHGNDLRKAILAIAQDGWKQIGITVETDLVEWSVFIQERVNKLDFDALVLGWSMGIEPDLYQIWHSSQTGPQMLNFVGFENKAADELIINIRQEYDHRRQVAYCRRLHEIIARQQPYTFLYVSKWTAVLDRRIVVKTTDESGHIVYQKIKPTQTGSYTFDFNRWVKLPVMPDFAAEG